MTSHPLAQRINEALKNQLAHGWEVPPFIWNPILNHAPTSSLM
jgi:hypothetical protein